jgi:alcohol dehydrogenase class IV
LASQNLSVVAYAIPGEPTLAMVNEGRALAVSEQCDAVVALGGGSAIDAGKAIAALAGNQGDLLDYMEIVGKAQPLPRPGLPCIALPTTAGTGAEVTKNSVISSPEAKVKASLRSPYLLPVLALVDPDLLDGLPTSVLATTGLDALSHLIESFVSIRANAFTLALAKEGMVRIARSLHPAFDQRLTAERREDLAIASLFGGLCLANSGLGAVHGFAAPLGGMWKAPHGAVCAALLPAVMRANIAALAKRSLQSPSLSRYRELSDLLAHGGDSVAWTATLAKALGIPGLSALGVRSRRRSLAGRESQNRQQHARQSHRSHRRGIDHHRARIPLIPDQGSSVAQNPGPAPASRPARRRCCRWQLCGRQRGDGSGFHGWRRHHVTA